MEIENAMYFPYSQEPAHPMVLEDLDDLVALYKLIRDNQDEIDAAFDAVSKRIGFIVLTTLPIAIKVGEKGTISGVEVGSENLKGTFFQEDIVSKCLSQKIAGKPVTRIRAKGPVAPRTYSLLLIWEEALKLKLRTDWMEPVHSSISRRPPAITAASAQSRRIVWEAREPAHWFDSGIGLDMGDKLQIEAIDRVYPDLRLAERVSMIRSAQRPMS